MAAVHSPFAVPDSRLARDATELIRSVESELLCTPWLKCDHDLRLNHRAHVIQRVVPGRKLTLVVGVGPSCCGNCSAFEDRGRLRDRKSLKFPFPRAGAGVIRKHGQHQQKSRKKTHLHPISRTEARILNCRQRLTAIKYVYGNAPKIINFVNDPIVGWP